MIPKAIQTTIHEHIRQGDTQPAIELLLANTTGEEHQEVLLLSARLDDIREKELMDLLAPEEIRRERNRINKAVLDITALSGKNKPARWWRHYGKWAMTAIYGIVGILATLSATRPKEGFEVNMNVLCNRVTFRYAGGGSLASEQALQNVQIQNFSRIEVQADSLAGRINTERPAMIPGSQLVFTPLPEIGGADFSAGPIVLSALDFTPGALLSLAITRDISNELQLDIQQSETTGAAFYFQDSLSVQSSYSQIAGWDNAPATDALAFDLFCASTGQLFATADGLSPVLYLHFPDTLDIRSHNLSVREPDFSRREDGVRISSILHATVAAPGNNGQPWLNIEVEEGEDLLCATETPLTITRLVIGRQGIQLALQGVVSRLATGPDARSRNPSVAAWWWHTRRLPLLILGALLGLSVLIIPGMWGAGRQYLKRPNE